MPFGHIQLTAPNQHVLMPSKYGKRKTERLSNANIKSLVPIKWLNIITEIDKSQAKLHKSAIGLHKYYRNSPLLNAMNVNQIPKLRDIYTFDLLRNAMYSQSQATTFYNCIINSDSYNNPCNIVSRVNTICHTNHVSFMQYVLMISTIQTVGEV